ncbi:unnamed protein product [Umbelopsis sp. WA50703]
MADLNEEERRLKSDVQKTYGSYASPRLPSSSRRSWRQTPSGYSSRATSDTEDFESDNNPPRHKRPAITSLSSFMKKRHSDTPNLVLPALDPSAEEVRESMNIKRSLEQMLFGKAQVNLSTVRTKYRLSRKKARYYEMSIISVNSDIVLYCGDYLKGLARLTHNNNTIVLFVYLDLLVDILFCLAYLMELKQEKDVGLHPPWLYKYRARDLWLFCQLLSFWDVGSYLIRFVLAGDIRTVLFSGRTIVEILTTLPFFVSIFLTNGQYLYIPYFLRSWVLLLRIKSAMNIRMNLQMTDKPFNPLKRKLIELIGTLIVIIFNGVSAFQYSEVTFGNQNLSLLDTLYFVMVAMSTVGFGDITPETEAGRLVIIGLIVCSVAALPSLVAGVLDTLRKQQAGGGHFIPDGYPFILLVGSYTVEQASDLLGGFFGMGEAHLSVVFLDTKPPSDEMKAMERNSMWGHRTRFLQGSAMNEKDLRRAQARYAMAIFTVSDCNAIDPLKEDERNTTRLWSLYCYTADRNIPLYACNLSPSTALYQKVATEVICIREFKHYLLALNVRCRGASTFITNLLHQRQPFNVYDEPWQAQFDDGASNEIYTTPPASCIVGLTFTQATWLLFKECQVILIAVKTFDITKDSYEIVLNPRQYLLKETDLCVYIAESMKEVRDVNNLSHTFVKKSIDALEKAIPASPLPPIKLSSTNSSQPGSSVAELTKNQNYRVSKLVSRKHALLTCKRLSTISFESDALSGSSAVSENRTTSCYMLETAAKFEDMLISNAEHMRAHIVVCLHREMPNLFRFIQNLRSPNIPKHELQDIVIMGQTRPRTRVVELINIFPRVHFMIGNCRHPDDLLRAGIKWAQQVVIMSERDIPEQFGETNPDSAAM